MGTGAEEAVGPVHGNANANANANANDKNGSAKIKKQLARIQKLGKEKSKNPASVDVMTQKRDTFSLYLAVAALAGCVVQVVICEIKHLNQDTDNGAVTALKVAGSLLTVVSLGCLGALYYSDFSLARRTMRVLEGDSPWTTGHATWGIFEACLLLLHSPLGLQFEIKSQYLSVDDDRHGWSDMHCSSDDLMCLIMFIRLYHLWRVVKSQLQLTTEMARTVCVWYQEEQTSQFFFRAILQEHHVAVVAVSFVVSLVVNSYLVLLFERKVDVAFESYFNSLWFTLTTMTTLGYGDMVVHTIIGRIIVMLVCLWSLIWIALLVTSILRYSDMTNRQKRVAHLITTARQKHELKRRAAVAVAEAWKAYDKGDDDENAPDLSPELSSSLRKFRTLRKKLAVPNEDETALLFNEMLDVRSNSDDMRSKITDRIVALTATVDELHRKVAKLDSSITDMKHKAK